MVLMVPAYTNRLSAKSFCVRLYIGNAYTVYNALLL